MGSHCSFLRCAVSAIGLQLLFPVSCNTENNLPPTYNLKPAPEAVSHPRLSGLWVILICPDSSSPTFHTQPCWPIIDYCNWPKTDANVARDTVVDVGVCFGSLS